MALTTWDDVLAYWRSKQVIPYAAFQRLSSADKNLAFSTALDFGQSLLDELAGALGQGLITGDVQSFRDEFDRILAKYGENPDDVAPYRLQLLFDQNLSNAMNAGLYADQFSDQGQLEAPAWTFMAIHDKRTDDQCMELDGETFYKGDLDARLYLPPIHFNCRCRALSVPSRDVASGDVQITSGKDLLASGLRPDDGFDYDKAAELVRLLGRQRPES